MTYSFWFYGFGLFLTIYSKQSQVLKWNIDSHIGENSSVKTWCWGILIWNCPLTMSSCTTQSHGSHAARYLTLGSSWATCIAVMPPNECPLMMRLSVSKLTLFPKPSVSEQNLGSNISSIMFSTSLTLYLMFSLRYSIELWGCSLVQYFIVPSFFLQIWAVPSKWLGAMTR